MSDLFVVMTVIADRNIYVDKRLPGKYFDSSDHWIIVDHNSPFASDPQLDNIPYLKQIKLDTTIEHLENTLLHIKALRLDRVYPWWTSKAYHGLVELRLIGPPQLTAIITENVFASILAESPKLRILHFGLEFIPTGTRSNPIRLEELEEFQLQSLLYATQQKVLRLILPGSKPLLMSTMYDERDYEYLPSLVEDEFCHFFRRSNIVQLQVHNGLISVQLPNLLKLLPSIRILIFRLVRFELLPSSAHGPPAVPLNPSLRDLHLISCEIDLETFQWLFSTHNLRKLVIYGSTIREAIDDRGTERTRDVPVDFHPIAQVLVKYEDTIKIEGWGEDLDDKIAMASMKRFTLF